MLAIALFLPTLGLGWTWDDAFLINFVRQYQPHEYLFSPKPWEQVQKVFTPLLMLSYDTDQKLFGLQPRFFYAHHLLAISLSILSLFIVLRLWWPPRMVIAGTLLFTLGVPFLSWGTQLMVRHYVEGFVLACLAIWLFTKASENSSLVISSLSAIAYLLAMLAKEVYVPLIVVLAILFAGRGSLRLLLPHSVALCGYMFWRRAVLGSFIGGYGWAFSLTDVPVLLLRLPVKVAHLLTQPMPWIATFVLGALLLTIIASLARSPRYIIRTVLLLLLTTLPVLPVSKVLEARFIVLLWLWLVLMFVFALDQLPWRPKFKTLLLASVAIGCGVVQVAARQDTLRQARQMSAESEFILQFGSRDVLRHPITPPAALAETARLRMETQRTSAPLWFSDDLYTCLQSLEGKRVWSYEAQAKEFRDVSNMVTSSASQFCSSLKNHQPLSANLSYAQQERALYWSLGPYDSGKYGFLLADGVQYYEMPRQDGFRLESAPGIALRVKYSSPEGWVTYSPELVMDFSRQRTLTWKREGSGRGSK